MVAFDTFSILMLTAAGFATAIAIYTLQFRFQTSVTTFYLFMLCEAQWFLCIGLWSSVKTPEAALFWVQFQFLGVASIPVLFLIYVLQHLGHRQTITAAQWMPLWIIPVLTQIAAWTNATYGWLFQSIEFTPEENLTFSLGAWIPGFWFFVHTAYSYGLILLAIVLLIRNSLKTAGLYRRQSALLLFAISIPLLSTTLNVLQILDPRQPITPLAFLAMGCIMAWNIFQNQWLYIVPIARNILMDHMTDGMLVLDANYCVVDFNPSLLSTLNISDWQLSGCSIDLLPGHWQAEFMQFSAQKEFQFETEIDAKKHYEIRVNSLFRNYQMPVGYLLIFRDITALKQAQKKLFDLATIDALTQLFNRRHILEQGQKLFEQAQNQGYSLSVVMLDIDYFKQINDQYGHQAGDDVLSRLGHDIQCLIRKSDYAGRYGGEEFLILQPQTCREESYRVSERLRHYCQKQFFTTPGGGFQITISLGIATRFNNQHLTFTDLIRQADLALYVAKRSGRNQTAIYRPDLEP